MNVSIDEDKKWGDLPSILDHGVQTLPQLLVYQARLFRDRIAQRKKNYGVWQRYTWSELLAKVKAVAMGLLSLGVERYQTVALIGENEPEYFWCQLAAQAIGSKVVCLYPDLTAAEMKYVLIHSDTVSAICEDQEQVDKVLELEPELSQVNSIIYWDDKGMWGYHHQKLITLEDVIKRGEEHINMQPELFDEVVSAGKGNDVALLSYTSGTTGLPKGCIITHTNLLDYAFRVAGGIHIKQFTEYLSYVSPAWLTEQILGVSLGLLAPMTLNFPEEPETVQENIRELGIEFLMLSPRQWESLAALVQSKMIDAGLIRKALFNFGIDIGHKVNVNLLEGKEVSLRARCLYYLADKIVLYHLRDNLGLQRAYLTVSGGSGMAPDVFRFFHSMGVKLRNGYGTTEMGLFTLHLGETFDLETVGKLLPVLGKIGPPQKFKVSEESELLMAGGSGFAGYYKDPDATSKVISDGWFLTGDSVNLTKKEELVYLDRISDLRQLSTNHSYPPQFIENRLRFSPFVKDVMTIGDKEKPYVSAFINIDAGTLGVWAEQRKIGYTTYTDLSQNQKIRELIASEIKKINHFLPEGSKVKRFINLPKELDADEGELTRTRKIRRKFLEEKYNEFILHIYKGDKEFKAKIPVKYRDGRSGVVNATVFVNDLIE